MYRKHNPWLSLVALLLLALILVLTCTGCTLEVSESGKRWVTAEAEETEPAPRFTIEHVYGNTTRYSVLEIITDNETGVRYLAYITSEGTGLTKLEE